MVEISWCDVCNVPVLNGQRCPLCYRSLRRLKVGKGEIRPVFEREKKWYRTLLRENGLDDHKLLPDGMCFFYEGTILVDGEKIFRVVFDEGKKEWRVKLFKGYLRYPVSLNGSEQTEVIRANSELLCKREKEALAFLREVKDLFKKQPIAVSFSGGKDSLAALNLTREIIAKLDVVFLNTTLEFPETIEFVHTLAEEWDLNLVEVSPPRDFFQFLEQMGPPSRFMKWCCKVLKFAPVSTLLTQKYPDGIVMVSGLRRAESRSRMSFSRIQRNEKIPKQTLVFPILDWSSSEVWLYLIWKGIPCNRAYEYGYSRIGCWCCPEKSLRDLSIADMAHPELLARWYSELEKFATRQGYDKQWVYDGKWRFRASKKQHLPAVRASRLCSGGEEWMYTVNQEDCTESVKEFLKVFGQRSEKQGLLRIARKGLNMSMVGRKIRASSSEPRMLKLFERQLEKALNCVGCGACVGFCPFGAIELLDGRITISDTCRHCLKCLTVNSLRMGCVSLNYRPETLSIKQQGQSLKHLPHARPNL